MTSQLEETRRQTALLEQMANSAAGNDTDFTKETNSSGFRATPYGM
jgi:hypothetical protein